MTRYLTLDVFTDRPFGGNPLAVIPDASGLPEPAFRQIAREFNYSETVFLLPPRDPAHTARLRILTPTMEVPFAGHPTIGAAVALAAAGHGPEMVLELGIGPLACHAADGAARFTTHRPLERAARPSAALVARCLGLDPGRIAGPPVQAGLGLPFTFAELADRAALAACRPQTDAFREAAAAHPSPFDFAVLAWCRLPGAGPGRLAARMFAPLDDIPEDPATGSACAALGALLGPGEWDIAQGEDMGRPSRIGVCVAAGGAVTVSGHAVPVMQGRIVAPGTG